MRFLLVLKRKMVAGRKKDLLFRLFESEKWPPVAKKVAFSLVLKRKKFPRRVQNVRVSLVLKRRMAAGPKKKLLFRLF